MLFVAGLNLTMPYVVQEAKSENVRLRISSKSKRNTPLVQVDRGEFMKRINQ